MISINAMLWQMKEQDREGKPVSDHVRESSAYRRYGESINWLGAAVNTSATLSLGQRGVVLEILWDIIDDLATLSDVAYRQRLVALATYINSCRLG